jgi:hypothetical protein
MALPAVSSTIPYRGSSSARGQGAFSLETRGWDDPASGVIEAFVFLIEFVVREEL